jgi:regulator of sirC expression with transglutaminase-like and TPR domain
VDADQVMFAHVVDRPDDEVQLDVAALMIGEWEYKGLDVAHYLAQLDSFAERVKQARLEAGETRYAGIRALNRVLFEKLGFRGNEDDYYDPRNSFLNEVIDRRVGIPITLSVLYMEVGRRVGLNIVGVSFPGHFLVRYDDTPGPLLIDPFHMGLTLDSRDLRRLLEKVSGTTAEPSPEMLRPAAKKEILSRMLTNLAAVYRRDGDVMRSIEVLERLQILQPDDHKVKRELEVLRRRASELN